MRYHLPLSDPLLETVDISVNLSGLQILDKVSIGVPEGSVTGLIGPNGAGKTTVFNIISGFLPADSGKVRFEGLRMRHTKAHKLTKMGNVPTYASPSQLQQWVTSGTAAWGPVIKSSGFELQ